MKLAIQNLPESGVASDKIFVFILGLDPQSSQPVCLNFDTKVLAPVTVDDKGQFPYTPGTTSRSLKDLKADQGFSIPPIRSARIYFAFNQDFPSGNMPFSGPSPSRSQKMLYEKVEFDTSDPGNCNINTTGVDFFAVSLTVTVTDKQTGQEITAGYTAPRSQVFAAIQKAGKDSGKDAGNPGIFSQCLITDGSQVLRALSPKSMAFEDWGSSDADRDTNATRCSHFFDDYINGQCWHRNRTFSFFDKTGKQLFASVDADGINLRLFSDPNRQTAYQVPVLPRPSTPVATPGTAQTIYHQTTGATAADIDWGFLLFGNVLVADNATGYSAPWRADDAVLSIVTAICRGVMHLDDPHAWLPQPAQGSGATNYYKAGDVQAPVFEYARILHDSGINRFAYALSLDDVFAQHTSLSFAPESTVTVRLHSAETATPVKPNVARPNAARPNAAKPKVTPLVSRAAAPSCE